MRTKTKLYSFRAPIGKIPEGMNARQYVEALEEGGNVKGKQKVNFGNILLTILLTAIPFLVAISKQKDENSKLSKEADELRKQMEKFNDTLKNENKKV